MFREQQEILNHQADGQPTADLKHTGHGFAFSDSVVREARHCTHVVRQENPTLLRAPIQHRGVIRPGQVRVLNPHNIKIRLPPEQPADDVVVEVLISGEPEHASGTRLGVPGEQAVSHTGRIEPAFVLCADGLCVALALVEVALHFRASPQVEGDDGVDVG
jgi:hypothetical protein